MEEFHKSKCFNAQRAEIVSPMVEQAIQEGLLGEEDPSIDVIDFDLLEKRIGNLQDAFPEDFVTNAIAMKANPMRGCFRLIKEMGCGAEGASFQEVLLALSLGFDPKKVIYDSPCKLKSELREAIKRGCYINLDNEEEVAMVRDVIKEEGIPVGGISQQFGLRINPLVGAGAIKASSTANKGSKFGLSWSAKSRNAFIEMLRENEWIHGFHVHVGSQGCSLDLLAEGVKKIHDFALDVNQTLKRKQISVLDIGGGVPTSYTGDNEAYDFNDYRKILVSKLPDLFSGKFRLVTEFGRSIFAKSGVSVSRVQATKKWDGQNISIIHVGANQFVRTAYLPEQVFHRVSVLDSKGHVKDDEAVPQDIAGPLCFGGDIVTRGAMLPQISTGDYVVIHDTAAYTMSMYSRYNSIRASAVYAYRHGNDLGKANFKLLKARETPEEVLAFWGI